MRKYSFFVLFLAVAFGAGGYFLRSYQLATAFEPHSGLAVRNSPATLSLTLLTIAFLVFAALFAFFTSRHHDKPQGLEEAFGTMPVAFLVAYVIVWGIWTCGTILFLPGFISPGSVQAADIYFVIISVFASVSVVFFAIGMYQDPKQKSLYPLSIVPIVFLCFWLILLYRQNASNPVLLSFVYQCLAVIASALSFYYTAGFLFGKPAPGRAIAAYLCAVFFCAVSLADNIGIGLTLIMCALLASAAISLFMLLRNLAPKHTEITTQPLF